MHDFLSETSQLTAASLLRAPINSEPDDPVLSWREAFQALVEPQEPHLLKAVAFSELQACTDRFFPANLNIQPKLRRVHDAVWIRGNSALYAGRNGMAIDGSFLTRFPRQKQTPTCSQYRIELQQPATAFPHLERALFLPFALCNNFGHFITETLAFLWPLFDQHQEELHGWPALLSHCSAGDPAAQALHSLLRGKHLFPLLETDLPSTLHLKEALIPEPSLRLHASCSRHYLNTAAALADWLLNRSGDDTDARPSGEKIYISRSALGPDARQVDQEPALEALLEAQGWTIVHPERLPLAAQVATYRQARVIAAFEGSALHGLSFLGVPERPPAVILLGDNPSPDYFLQFRAQELPGFFIQSTRVDPNNDRPDWVRPRLLNGSVEALANMIRTLSVAI